MGNETGKIPIEVLMRELASPAQRAITAQGITSLDQLAVFTASQMMEWHGIGKSALTVIARVLADYGFDLDEDV